MKKFFLVFVTLVSVAVFVKSQSQKDFDNWVNKATYNPDEQSYHNTICDFCSTQSKFLNYFSKRTDIALIDYSCVINSINNRIYVTKFSFRYVKWKRGCNLDKKDNVFKAFEAGIEHENNFVCYAYIPKNEKQEKINKWFVNNSDYKIINKEDTYSFFVITFSLAEKEYEAKAYIEKSKIFREATNLEKMVAARKKYADYTIPLPIKEIAGRLACRCYMNPNQSSFGSRVYYYYDAEPTNSNLTFEVFLSAFPEYKKNIEFMTEFFKLLENNEKYNHNHRVERVKKFIEVFEDKEIAKQFVLNSVGSREKLNVLWCGLTLTDIINIFGDDDELFSSLITKRMDVVSDSELGKYLNMTKDYKTVEEYIYKDFEKTKNNPFRTWRSWLDRAREIRPLLVGNIDLSRVDKCIKEIESLLRARAEAWRRFMQDMCAECEIDERRTELPAYEEEWALFIGWHTVQNPGKIIMKNTKEYEFYYSENGKWCLKNAFGFTSKEFKSGTEMIKFFIEECRNVYCKKNALKK